MKNIEIFTGPGCTYCDKAKALLDKHRLRYRERNIDNAEVFEELRRRLPRARALPQIFVDGVHIGSFEDLQFRLSVKKPPGE